MEEKQKEIKDKEKGNFEKRWYVVHTYSGYEEQVKALLEQRIKKNGMEEFFGDIFIPSEEVIEEGEKTQKRKKKKFFPGYIFVEMVMSKDSWHLVRKIPYVTGFVGNQKEPSPVPEDEVNNIISKIKKGELKLKPSIDVGDQVRVIEGPFVNFTGTVTSVNAERKRLTVKVSIFGRHTPVELDFSQVEKIA